MRISDWSSDVCSSDLLLDRLYVCVGPDLDGQQARLWHADRCHLVHRHRGAVAVHVQVLEQSRRGPPRPEARELPLQRIDRAVHAAFDVLRIGGHYFSPFTSVNRPSPLMTRFTSPLFCIENTMIGMSFSRHSVIAAQSITLRSRCRDRKSHS